MIIFLKRNEDIDLYFGSDVSNKRRDVLDQFHKTFGRDVEPVFKMEAGGTFRFLCQQFENRPFPQLLEDQNLIGPYYQAQFHNQLINLKPGIVVLSIEHDLCQPCWQHKTEGFYFAPEPGWQTKWTAEQQAWLAENFVSLGLISAEQFQQTLTNLVQLLTEELETAVIIANSSTIDLSDDLYSYRDRKDSLSLRTNRFNLALLRVSKNQGVSILDVDRLVAEAGAAHVTKPHRYTETVNGLIRHEFVRIIDDLGLVKNDEPVFRLEMPYIDLSTTEGQLFSWHKKVGDLVNHGDLLFDVEIQFKKLKRTQSSHHLSRGKSSKAGGKIERLLVQVVSNSSGILWETYAQPGSRIIEGSLVAALTTEDMIYEPDQPLNLDRAGKFRASVVKQNFGEAV